MSGASGDRKKQTLDEAFQANMKVLEELAFGGAISDLRYDNEHALCISRYDEGEYSDSWLFSFNDDDRFSAEQKRDTLLRNARQDVALITFRVERVLGRLKKLESAATAHMWLGIVTLILNSIILYKVISH
jgi:hypothetical protein